MVSEVLREIMLTSPFDRDFESEKRVRERRLAAEVPET